MLRDLKKLKQLKKKNLEKVQQLWNEIPLFLREKPKKIFKKELEMILIDIFKEGDLYIKLSTIISNKVK